MVEHWADWAMAIVEDWPDDMADAPFDRPTLVAQAQLTRARATGA
jgi:hypothetical protein